MVPCWMQRRARGCIGRVPTALSKDAPNHFSEAFRASAEHPGTPLPHFAPCNVLPLYSCGMPWRISDDRFA